MRVDSGRDASWDGTVHLMEIDVTRSAAYVGAGAAVGGGFAALRAGRDGGAIGRGVATGVLAGSVQSYVTERTGSSELGWLAAIGSGAATGAVLLSGLAPATLGPMGARGFGAAVGATTGLLAPVVAGMVLAQFRDPGT